MSVQTKPIRPIEDWGRTNVEYLDLSSTDGPDWRSKLSAEPSVIVAIDVDVHSLTNWADFGWPRPLGICQWTLSGAPSHPIFLDAARRVVNATRVVEDWEEERVWAIENFERLGKKKEAEQWRKAGKDHAMNVMEWTGPGLFTDSVIA
jgi:alpha 1,6-mannosyltransferase